MHFLKLHKVLYNKEEKNMTFKRRVINAVRGFWASWKEWGGDIFRYPWAFRRGFTRDDVRLFGITKDNHREFISRREEMALLPFNRPYQGACSDKLGLVRILHEHKELLPKYYYYIDQFGFLPLWDHPERDTLPCRADFASFLSLVGDLGKVIVKPTHSTLGEGVMLVEAGDTGYSINGREASAEELRSRVCAARNSIVTECVRNNEWTRKINPSSLNTIRMLGVWDGEKKEFAIVRSFHRFGCNGSVVDNLGGGNAIAVFIDPETGITMEEGVYNLKEGGEYPCSSPVHPDSQILLTGLEIPGYLAMKREVLKILNENSYLRYVGLDIAMTDDGFRILEANGRSDMGQNVGGYLKDRRMRDLFGGYQEYEY